MSASSPLLQLADLEEIQFKGVVLVAGSDQVEQNLDCRSGEKKRANLKWRLRRTVYQVSDASARGAEDCCFLSLAAIGCCLWLAAECQGVTLNAVNDLFPCFNEPFWR